MIGFAITYRSSLATTPQACDTDQASAQQAKRSRLRDFDGRGGKEADDVDTVIAGGDVQTAAQALCTGEHAFAYARQTVLIERYGPRISQGPATKICCKGVKRDAREREDITQEIRVGVNGCGATHIPEHSSAVPGIDDIDNRVRRRDQRTRHLENPACVGITLAVKGDRTRQVCRSSGDSIDAWRQNQSGQIRR